MTYTTVHKDYEAPTLRDAAEKMLRDDVVWDYAVAMDGPGERGGNRGYGMVSWEWTPSLTGLDNGTLRVHFR